jgi:hypothetical protein
VRAAGGASIVIVWISGNKDYERKVHTSETRFEVAAILLVLRRVVRDLPTRAAVES